LKDPAQHGSGTGRDLVRSVIRNVLAPTPPEADEQWLMGNVQSMQFSSYDGANWRDSWDTSMGDTNLPAANPDSGPTCHGKHERQCEPATDRDGGAALDAVAYEHSSHELKCEA